MNNPSGPSTITMKQEDIDQMNKDNEKAEAIFTEKPEGRDDQDSVFYSTDVMFKEIPDVTVLSNSASGDKMPERYRMIITRNGIGITPVNV